MDPKNHWRLVCAPSLKARKKELGRGIPEKSIAAYVEVESGYNTKRSLVSGWLLGTHQPYIGQFIALCNKMGVDPFGILRGEILVSSTASPTRQFLSLSNNSIRSHSKIGQVAKSRQSKKG